MNEIEFNLIQKLQDDREEREIKQRAQNIADKYGQKITKAEITLVYGEYPLGFYLMRFLVNDVWFSVKIRKGLPYFEFNLLFEEEFSKLFNQQIKKGTN